jgi:hypothetical protein
MTNEEKVRRGTRVRMKLREQFDMPPDWPLKLDPVTMEYYDPIERYLNQLHKNWGERLFAALHSVIDAERRGWQ